MSVQQRLLKNDPDVLSLFAGNPFAKEPPKAVRAVVWRYWFTTREERARTVRGGIARSSANTRPL